MLKLSVGKGRQVMKQLCLRALQYYAATVATERAGYVLYRALVSVINWDISMWILFASIVNYHRRQLYACAMCSDPHLCNMEATC